MSRLAEIRDALADDGEVRLPIDYGADPENLTKKERHLIKQRLRVAIMEAAWKIHLTVKLQTTDTEVIGTVVKPDDHT